MTYKPSHLVEYQKSPAYFVRHWRKAPELCTEEDALNSFTYWLEDDSEAGAETIKAIKSFIDEYLGRDMNKIAAGEQELLEKWKESTK